MTAPFPKTALITWFPPDMRYAGCEFLRKVVSCLPQDGVLWCSLAGTGDGAACCSFEFPRMHWRMRGTTLEYLFTNHLLARSLARRIHAWLTKTGVERIWTVAELSGINVAYALGRLSGLPVHATVHDAHEFSRHVGIPPAYHSLYVRSARRLLRSVQSLDCISEELLQHVQAYGTRPSCRGVVVPPSVARAAIPAAPPVVAMGTRVRRIGFCGAMRVRPWQWREFLNRLAALPYDFEFLAVAHAEPFFGVELPGNVRFVPVGYAETETDLIACLRGRGVHACYLGVWRDPELGLFGRTSLSSKLATYAAVGAPLIVDASEDSVAWRLVSRFGAGVQCGMDTPQALKRFGAVFENTETWQRMANGALTMCREHFELESNAARLARVLTETAGRTAC